jgi:DNA segregation ATPase FtsK/SpoIIIE-like protein
VRGNHKYIGISIIQRSLRIGWNRAAALLEQLEAGGVVTKMDQYGRRRLVK